MYRIILALGLVLGPAAAANAWDYYAAIAYSPSTGTTGYSFGCSSQESAEAMALQYCNTSDARIAVWARKRLLRVGKGQRPRLLLRMGKHEEPGGA